MRRDLGLISVIVGAWAALAGCGGGGGGLTESTPSDFCKGRALVEPALPETLEGNHYLSAQVGTYTVATSLYLAEGTLCIEPGVRVAIAKGGRVVVGSDREAALKAVGKLADGTPAPIVFTSAAATPHLGDWDKIHFTPKNLTDVSVLDTVVVEYAGAHEQHGRASVVVEGTSVALKNVRLRMGLGLGLNFETADAFPSAFEGLYFENLGAGALALEIRHLARLAGGASVGAGVERALLRGGGLYESATLPSWGVHWVLEGNAVGLQNGAVLTVEAGVEVQMGSGMRLTAGGETAGGFDFEGTAEAPIVLQSSEQTPGPGDWDKIVVTPKTSRAVFRHVTLRHAGQLATSGGQAALVLGGPVDELTDVHIEESAGYGVLLQDTAPQPSAIDGLTITASALPAFSLVPRQLALLTDGLTLDDDATIELRGGELADPVDLADAPWPVHVTSRVSVVDGGALLLPTGATWVFDPGAGLWVGAEGGATLLLAVGSAEAPVRFTSAAAVPAPGDWDKLLLGPGCQGQGCTLRHVVVEYGGGGDLPAQANVAVVDCDATLDDVDVSYSAGWGLWISMDANPTIGKLTAGFNVKGNEGP